MLIMYFVWLGISLLRILNRPRELEVVIKSFRAFHYLIRLTLCHYGIRQERSLDVFLQKRTFLPPDFARKL